MKNWNTPLILNAKITLLTGDKQNIYYLYNFINETKYKWDIIIYPEISNIMELVSTNNLFIKMLVVNGNIEAVYIFRKTCIYIEKEKELVLKMAALEDLIIPDSFNYEKLSALSAEAKQKFIKIKPRTLGQASRISGVNPSDVQILMVYMGR
jgi:tRNA U34 5-carboxymethylaminomethyl modifying enzyme MnmG/GidA